MSAKNGDNVVLPSENTPWYEGPTLLEHLESVPVAGADRDAPFRFPVQYVVRPRTDAHPDYRGYAGLVAAGTVRVGDEVAVLPDGQRTRVEGIDTFDGELEAAYAGQSVDPAPRRRPRHRPRRRCIAAPGAPEPVTEFDATARLAAREAAAARARGCCSSTARAPCRRSSAR